MQNPVAEYPQLRIEYAAKAQLSGIWGKTVLSGHFWRLYHNSASGAGIFYRNRKYEFFPDKIYILAPHCDLRTWCSGEPVQYYLHFELSGICGNPEDPVHELPLSENLNGLLRQFESELSQTDFAVTSHAKLLSIALVSAAMAALPSPALTELDADRRILAICEFIRGNIQNSTLSLDSLSARAKMPENTFLRHFKYSVGCSPYQYLTHLRYERAAQMLESSTLPIDEICQMVGINDRFHFSRTFKKIYGSAPGEYRRTRAVH